MKINRSFFLSFYIAVCVLCGIGLGSVCLTGCSTTQQQSALANLLKIGSVVDAGYQEYLGLVAAGVVKTNNVANITKQYAEFHALLAAVQHLAVISSTPPQPQVELSNAASQLQLAVKSAKADKK